MDVSKENYTSHVPYYVPDQSKITHSHITRGMLLLKMAFPCVKGKSWQSVLASKRCFYFLPCCCSVCALTMP